jgi:hypothetical protein
LGITAGIVMHFDLPSILNQNLDLSDLAAPFEISEIDNLIRILPPNKAPGPDGFNGLFMPGPSSRMISMLSSVSSLRGDHPLN